MNSRPLERMALFIDGANLYSASRALGLEIDFKRLLDEFRGRGELVRAYYYTVLVEDQDYSPVRPLVDWLDYNGFAVATKTARRYSDPNGGPGRIKGDMDVEIAVDMLLLADRLDHIVLVSGDGDFRRAVEAVQAKGVRVTVVSTTRSQPPMASDELRRQADAFLDLNDLAQRIGRPRAQAVPRFLQDPAERDRVGAEDGA